MYWTISQTATPCRRTCELVSSGVYQPRYTPAATAESTAETPSSSAGRNAKYPVSNEIVISAGGLSRRRRTWRTIHPTASPTATPPSGAHDEEPTRVQGRERARNDRGDGDAVQHEARAVVDEALALDDRHEPPRNAESACDGGRRDRIGG